MSDIIRGEQPTFVCISLLFCRFRTICMSRRATFGRNNRQDGSTKSKSRRRRIFHTEMVNRESCEVQWGKRITLKEKLMWPKMYFILRILLSESNDLVRRYDCDLDRGELGTVLREENKHRGCSDCGWTQLLVGYGECLNSLHIRSEKLLYKLEMKTVKKDDTGVKSWLIRQRPRNWNKVSRQKM